MAKKRDEDDPWFYVVFRDTGIEVDMHPTKWTEIGAKNLSRAVRSIRRQRMLLRKQAIMTGGTYVRRFEEQRGTVTEGVDRDSSQVGSGSKRPGGESQVNGRTD